MHRNEPTIHMQRKTIALGALALLSLGSLTATSQAKASIFFQIAASANKMQPIRKIGLALIFCLALLACPLAHGQPRPNASQASAARPRLELWRMMGPTGLTLLYRDRSVQQELLMTLPQKEKMNADVQELLSLSPQPSPVIRINLNAAQQANAVKKQHLQEARGEYLLNQSPADILDSRQLARFRQLELQVEGPAALTRRKVADALQLTAAQRQKVESIQDGALSRMQGIAQDENHQQTFLEQNLQSERIQAVLKDASNQLYALLTDKQRERWNQMLGAPFFHKTGWIKILGVSLLSLTGAGLLFFLFRSSHRHRRYLSRHDIRQSVHHDAGQWNR